MGKKRFFASHAKSSAMMVSLAVHGILIAIAVTFVAVSVIPKEEPAFEVKKVKRPKMPLKKIKVPVDTKKRKPKPRLRKRILSQKKSFTDIKMPEITGVAGGLGNMGGDGLGSLGFDLDMDLFGSDRSMGSELEGTFYDLKQTKDGKPIKQNHNKYRAALAHFCGSWKESRLDDYFQAPAKKYATFFMTPFMPASEGPKAFGVDNVVKPSYWAAVYKGRIAAPETGYYRFCGLGDDVMVVRVRRRVVLDACYHSSSGKVTDWKSDADENFKWPMVRLDRKTIQYERMVIGDWIKLTKGKPEDIEILLGEVGGGDCYFKLMVQQRGVKYKEVPFSCTFRLVETDSGGFSEKANNIVESGTRPILPVFQTREIPEKLHDKIKLDPNVTTYDGPTFGVQE